MVFKWSLNQVAIGKLGLILMLTLQGCMRLDGLGSLNNEKGHWHWSCLFTAVFCSSLCAAWGLVKRHLCWVKCHSSCVTQLRAMETWPCPFCLPENLSLEQNVLEILPSCCCHPHPCPTRILRSKIRPISVVSSSPWAKVKGFSLRAAENTGLARELSGLASTPHQCFRFCSYWFPVMKHSRKRGRNWLCVMQVIYFSPSI